MFLNNQGSLLKHLPNSDFNHEFSPMVSDHLFLCFYKMLIRTESWTSSSMITFLDIRFTLTKIRLLIEQINLVRTRPGTILFPLIIEGPIDIASAKDAEGTNKLWLHSLWLSIRSYIEISVITPCYEKR